MFAQNRVPPWLFAITSLPFGIGVAFATSVMPNLMSKAGIKIDKIGWYTVAVMLPAFTQFLYAPIIETFFRKRSWLILGSVLAALCFGVALQMPLSEKNFEFFFLLLTVIGQFMLSLVSASNGALMATVISNEQRGKAAGFYNMGNISGGALGAGLFFWLLDKNVFSSIYIKGITFPSFLHIKGIMISPLLQLGGVVTALVAFPALMALAIPEPVKAQRLSVLTLLQNTLKDVGQVLSTRAGWTGVLFCLSPVSTVALTNYLSALSKDYHVSSKREAIILGPLIGLVSALGSLLGGFLCDRFPRRHLYIASGVLTIVVNLLCAALPLTERVFIVAVTLYLLVAGLAYAAASAVVLELIGKSSRSTATQYSLFVAAGNFAITYVGWVDTRFYEKGGPGFLSSVFHKGPASLFQMDAFLNALGIVVLLIVSTLVARSKKKPTVEQGSVIEKSSTLSS